MPDPILYHDADHTVVLIDVPTSIERAQQSNLILASVPPTKEPYPSTEPRGNKREVALSRIPAHDQTYHSSVQCLIREALTKIAYSRVTPVDGQGGSWYRPRHYMIGGATSTDLVTLTARALQDGFLTPVSDAGGDGSSVLTSPVPVILSSTELRTDFPSPRAVQNVVVRNPRPDTSLIFLHGVGAFWVPPHATFIQSTIESGWEAFASGSRVLALRTPNFQLFDLIMMDPPWSNRSARRSRHYNTAESQKTDPFDAAVQIARNHLTSHGIVAVWITNRAAIRKTVLDTFRALDFQLYQEWVWVKITAEGDPVVQLDGIWRRPYEICLLFQNRNCQGQCSDNKSESVVRRVLAAVPDLHSRKPNLKCLLEQHLPIPPHYEALELFARSLTAGWWSWGDEVLKFQHESQWASPDLIQNNT